MGWTENNGLIISGIAITDQAKIGTVIGVGTCLCSIVSTIVLIIYTIILTNFLATTISRKLPLKLIAVGLLALLVVFFLSAVVVEASEAFL